MSNYSAGLKAAREILRPLAQSGQREAAIMVDRATGRHLDVQLGERDEVTPDWSRLRAGTQVTLLHTHAMNLAFGPEDWDCLANQPQVLEMQVVCPTETYTLSKPHPWMYQDVCRAGLSVFGSVFRRHLNHVQTDPAFAREHFASLDDAQAAQIWETNVRLVQSAVGRGFRLARE